MQLHEQYRPKKWSEVIGQDKALRQIETLRKRGLSGRAYFISGGSGTGKTTIAKLLAQEVADDMYIEEINATTVTPGMLEEIESQMSMFGWGKGGKAYIFNEAHGLRKPAMRQMLDMLERLPKHVIVIFTTTSENLTLFEENLDAGPLLSRCQEIALSRRDLSQVFAERAKDIAICEGLNGKPVEDYVKLVQKHKNNLRKVLQEIEKGAMSESAGMNENP